MTSPAMIRAMFEFNQAMNEQLWQIIMQHLTDEQFVQEDGYSHGSIRSQVVHLADGQHFWLRWLLKMDLPEFDSADYPTREAARAICQQADQTILDRVRTLSETELSEIPDGWSLPLWVGLTQNALHGVDHRAQILRALHNLGVPTFDQSFGDYMERATPMSAAVLSRHIDQQYGKLVDLLRQVPEDQMEQVVLNDWTVRDVIAVLMWSEQKTVEMIRSRAYPGLFFSQLDEAERTRIFEAGRALSRGALFDQFQVGHRDLLEAIGTVPDAEMNVETISGMPEAGVPTWKAIAIPTWWRYGLFMDPIRQLLKMNV